MARHRESAGLRHLGMLFDSGATAGLTDGQLLERFATRGGASAELAFEALVERHGPMVYRTCLAVLRDGHDAQDAFQATFLILARKGATLWVRDSIGPWLHRVARRAAGRVRREAERRRGAERGSARPAECPGDSGRLDLLSAIHAEVDRLPDRFRIPVVLCDLEGRGYEEAARDLGCPVGTIKSRLARGRERLRVGLTRRGLAPGLMAGPTLIDRTGPVMPAALVRATIAAATGAGMPGAILPIIEEVCHSMIISRLKIAMFRSTIGAALVLGGAVAASMARQGPPGAANPTPAPTAGVKPDEPAPGALFASPSWRRTDVYEPPDFERFFPDDPEGAKRLAALWDSPDKETRPDDEILRAVRQGMRRASGRLRAEALRWIGGRYVWGKLPQNPDAIEIMYHAIDCPSEGAMTFNTPRHYAVYFGLSTVHLKPPAVLRALVDLCMLDDDHTVFGHEEPSRIAWGASSQQAELLAFLEPYLSGKDQATRERAAGLEKVFKGRVDAHEWWRGELAKYARAKHGARLPELREALLNGDSRRREEALRLIDRESIGTILDPPFLPALAACAEDKDPRALRALAPVVGRLDEATYPGSTDILLRLAKSEDPQVRRDAMYYGLAGRASAEREDVLRAVVAFALSSGSTDLKEQIDGALSDNPEATAKILEESIRGDNLPRSLAARSLYREVIGKAPPGDPEDDPAAQGGDAKAFWDLYEFLGRTYPNFAMKGIDWDKVGKEFRPRVAAAKGQDESGLLIEELMARLEDSHAVVLPGTATPPLPDLPRWDPGLACLIDDRGRPVVYAVEPKSPADRAGIKPGMTLISANGVKSEDRLDLRMKELRRYHGFSSERLLRQDAAMVLTSQMEKGSKVSIALEDPEGRGTTVEVAADRGPRYLPRLPVPRRGIADAADLSWTTLEGRVGYIYVRRIAQGLEASLDAALKGLGDVKGLIVDMRGNSGGGFDVNTAFVNFDPSADDKAGARPRYTGPIALLIDERCISAGEGWASWFVARKRARLFGATTAGASCRKITHATSDGRYKVVVPVKAYTGFLDRPIERRGLEPDVEVRCNARDLARGRDTVVEEAAGWLSREGEKRP